MCGIVGIFSFETLPPFQEHWPELVNHLRHRGPDEGAWWADGPFFFGHRRLSIIDLKTGGQPMATPDGEFVVTFNGEIYNYLELRQELEKTGVVFTTTSDTEVLLHGYRIWGRHLPEKLIGMFAFAIADRRKRELFLARDRFGEKPLFMRRTSKYVAFASELRPLAALPDMSRELNFEAFGGYLCLNYVPGTATLCKGIQRLSPASWMVFDQTGKEQYGWYWSAPDTIDDSSAQTIDEAVDELHKRLDRAVSLCLRSDVPVGIFLSGGMDSSLIAESAMRQGKLTQAYFLDFEEKSYSEYDAALEVAQRLGVPLQKTTLTQEAVKNFAALVEHADDPMADSSALNVWTISACAAQSHKVVLGGDGGDELFGGYLTYQASQWHQQVITRVPIGLRRSLAWVSRYIPISERKVTTSYKLWRFLRAAHLSTAMAHFTWNGTWLPDEAAAFICSDVEREIVRQALPVLLTRLNLPQQTTLLDLQRTDIAEYLPNDILTKVDRMSMAHGLETRAPFLNHELAEWALRRPNWQKVNVKHPKILLRELARRIYGDSIAERPKKGFSIPIHRWLRGPLREMLLDTLSPESLKSIGIFDTHAINKVVVDHLTGRKSYGFELWGLMVFVIWYRLRIARPPVSPQPTELIQKHFAYLNEEYSN